MRKAHFFTHLLVIIGRNVVHLHPYLRKYFFIPIFYLKMNVEIIGEWAGKAWTALNEQGALSMKGLKKATKLKEKELYAAIGWLAREGKLNISEAEEEIMTSLI